MISEHKPAAVYLARVCKNRYNSSHQSKQCFMSRASEDISLHMIVSYKGAQIVDSFKSPKALGFSCQRLVKFKSNITH